MGKPWNDPWNSPKKPWMWHSGPWRICPWRAIPASLFHDPDLCQGIIVPQTRHTARSRIFLGFPNSGNVLKESTPDFMEQQYPGSSERQFRGCTNPHFYGNEPRKLPRRRKRMEKRTGMESSLLPCMKKELGKVLAAGLEDGKPGESRL